MCRTRCTVRSLIGEGIYEKKLSNGMRWGAGIRHTHSFSNNDYINGHNYHTQMQQGSTYLYGELRGKAKKLDYMVGIGGTRSFYRQESSVDLYQYYTFNPRLTLKYTFNDRSYLRLRSSISNEMPSLGNLSAIDQVIDSLQIQRGNPNLEAYLHYSNTLDGEWSKGIFYTYFSLAYNYKPRAIMDEKYVEGNKIIQTWDNQKSWQRIAPMVQLRVGPIADILQFSVSGGLNHFISRGNTYSHKYSNWWLDASVSASWKNFNFMYQVMTNQNWFSGETLKGGENAQIIMLNYKWKDLQIGAGMFNPFTNDYKSGKCPDGLPHLKLQLLVRASLQECQQENQQPGFGFRHHADREIEFLPRKRLDVSMKTSVRLNQNELAF